MSFGLINVSTTFQCFINDNFSNFLNTCMIIYLNDILIYSDNIVNYTKYIKEIFYYLWKARLYVKAENYKFHSKLVEYLKYIYIIFSSGPTMAKNKIKIIKYQPEPRKVKDIQLFLRFTKFYYRFIYKYSDIIIPLIHLTWKNIFWSFNNFCCETFNTLKQIFTFAFILSYQIPNTQLIVKTNASNYTLTAILSIITLDNKVHLVVFHSHIFNPTKLNYNIYDKKLLAIFKAFQI